MNTRSTRSFGLTASTLVLGLVAWAGFAHAEPLPMDELASVPAPPSAEPDDSELASWPSSDPEEAIPATNYQCQAQCWRDFVDCLSDPNCSEAYCQEQKDICMSFC